MRVNVSLSAEGLVALDAYAAKLGVSRSAAIERAVDAAENAPTMADLRLLVAKGVNQVTQKRVGVQEVEEVEGELVKGEDPETAENREAFLRRERLEAATRGPFVSGVGKSAPAPGERVVEPVDPLDF